MFRLSESMSVDPRERYLYSLFPVGIAALFKANGQGTVGIGALVASPADGPPHAFDLNLGAQNDLLAVHFLGKDKRRLAQFAGERLPRIEIASYFDASVGSLGIHAQNSRHAGNTIVHNAQNQLHCVVAFSLPNDRGTHAITEPLLHGAKRIGILLVVAPDVFSFGPQAKIVRPDIKRVKARALAVGAINRAADAVGIIIGGHGFVVGSNECEHRATQFAQASFLLGSELGEHVVPVFTVFHDDGDPGRTMAEFFNLDGLIHDETVGAQPTPSTNRHILHLPIAHIADVRLRVD